ncbi:MAG: ATP-binding protein [Legionella sp.]|nr:ATP-binding protein [Legionella sp.]
MELHKLLKRQLERLGLSYDSLPSNLVDWQSIINSINKSYVETDQERYLLERSMSISSNELMEINDQLERAQHLAGLCYWHYDSVNSLMSWSRGIYDLLQISPLNSSPTHTEFRERVFDEDKILLTNNVKNALLKKEDSDFEIRIKVQERYIWFRIIVRHSEKNDHELSGIIMDINSAKEAETQIKELNSALLTTARLAGMSEVATTILHNIGNLLNSINVSLSILKTNIASLHHQKLSQLIAMINANSHHLEEFLFKDPKGKLIIPYIVMMSETMTKEYQSNTEEIIHLEKNLSHIQDIVAMQQSISGVSGLFEKISVPELMENALEMTNLKGSELKLTVDISQEIKTIVTDKSKLLQIMTNLLRNAKQSVSANEETQLKKIGIIVNKKEGKIKVIVKDNGVGIPAENLKRIFSFGFTTKIDGHGFGLHSSALSAKELGGTLNVHSPGVGKGAEFVLILPINRSRENVYE